MGKPRKKREPSVVAKRERTSPCAAKCRHVWCAGYNAGYQDGHDDGASEELTKSRKGL